MKQDSPSVSPGTERKDSVYKNSEVNLEECAREEGNESKVLMPLEEGQEDVQPEEPGIKKQRVRIDRDTEVEVE